MAKSPAHDHDKNDGEPEPLPLLPDRVRQHPRPRVLFVGINPGIRSSRLGHHFAGASNRFWKLVSDAELTPRRATFEDDVRMPEWGFAMTNLVPRPTRGIDELAPAEYHAGRARLERLIRRAKPEIVALIGVTLARSLLTDTPQTQAHARTRGTSSRSVPSRSVPSRGGLSLGLQTSRLADTPVFVLPNPSGRNAHFSYATMLDAFRALKAWLDAATPAASPSRR